MCYFYRNPMTPPPARTSEKATFGRSGTRRFLQFLFGREGGVASEFALVAAPFIALLLAILQVGLIYFAQAALETDVEASARQVLTGQALANGLTQAKQFANVVCANSPGLFTCKNFMIDLQPAPFLLERQHLRAYFDLQPGRRGCEQLAI
jgi:Flp pilus assembly protein TadG